MFLQNSGECIKYVNFNYIIGDYRSLTKILHYNYELSTLIILFDNYCPIRKWHWASFSVYMLSWFIVIKDLR